MFKNVEEIQKFNKDQIEAATAAASTFFKGLKQLAEETAEFSKKNYDASSATAEKFFGANLWKTRSRSRPTLPKQPMRGLLLKPPRSARSIPISPRTLSSRSLKLSLRYRPRSNLSLNLIDGQAFVKTGPFHS